MSIGQTDTSPSFLLHGAFSSSTVPDEKLTVSEWAEKYRMLSSKASAEPGPWRTDRVPYAKEIMDSLSAQSPYIDITLMKGAQIAGTEIGNNWVGYIIDVAPGPIMVIMPTVETVKRNSKIRIAPLLEETPRLRDKIKSPRSRDSGNTIQTKEYPGGVMVLTGANSAVGLRSMPARYAFGDEIDAYPGDVEGEGDPMELIEARMRTFGYRRKFFKVSTPTIKGKSRIEQSFEASDKRYFFIPCPHCGHEQRLVWGQMKWEKDKPETVYYQCEDCSKPIYNHHKQYMLAKGEWRATAEPKDPARIGFHLSSLYSPVGWYSWEDAVRDWLKAQDDTTKLISFINTVLGETWEERGESPEWKLLHGRRENYTDQIIPEGGLRITAGADIQADRIEVETVAWGKNLESWSIDYQRFYGDTNDINDQVWQLLEDYIDHEFPYQVSENKTAKIWLMALDTGGKDKMTQTAYRWARRNKERVMAIKGRDSEEIISPPTKVDVSVGGKRLKGGLKLWTIGVSAIKKQLYRWLRHELPVGYDYPSGYCHFPKERSEEYFQQLTAETYVKEKDRKGYDKFYWKKTRERNEALDCRVYATAAAYRLGLDRFTEGKWQEIANSLVPKSTSKNKKQTAPVRRRRRTRR